MALMQVDIESPDGQSGARIEVDAEDRESAESLAQAEWPLHHAEPGVVKGVFREVA